MFERDNHKPGAGRLRTVLAVVAVTAVVASMAIVGTVAAQPGQRFLDVPRTHYAYQSIEWAVLNGITQGCGDGRYFCPDDTLNRAHMVTFLKRYHDRFHGGTVAGTGTSTATTTTVPQEHVLSGIGSGDFDSVTLPAGRYRVSIAVVLSYTFPSTGALDSAVADDKGFHPIKKVTVTAGGQNTATDRVILEYVPDKVDVDPDRPTTRRWTVKSNPTTLMIRRGLLEVPPGRIDFTVTLEAAPGPISGNTGKISVAAAVWEITISG